VINVSTNKVIANIAVGLYPYGVAYDPSNGYVYVTNEGSNNVSVINVSTNKVIANIAVGYAQVGPGPQGAAYDPSNGYVYVTDGGSDEVSVINGSTNKVIANIAVEYGPRGAAYDSSNGYVYVANIYSNSVSVINGATNTVIANISVGSEPWGVAYDPSNGYVYVANSNSNNVSVINGLTNKVIANIAVGSGPFGVAYDPSNGYVYVANSNSNNVSVINGLTNKVIANIAVGSGPFGVAYDPSNMYVYVTNSNSGTVSIISTSPLYTLTFTESGLPSGTSWSVTINGTTQSSTTNTITFSVPNGTYSYMVATANKNYKPNPSSGLITVSGSNVSISISFSLETYTVNFVETGLPSGYWYVNITGLPSSGPIPSSQASYSLSLPNGSYSYTVSTGNKEYKPSYTGYFTVNGTNVNIAIKFTLVTYTITFTESGLPSGTIWYVNLNNGQSFSSTTNIITFNEPNGTYPFKIIIGNNDYAPKPSSGIVTVSGSNVDQIITFYLVEYSISFNEEGLPSGTTWYVNLSNGQLYSSSTNTITFNETNGTYSYTVTSSNKEYSPAQYSGSFIVNGATVSESITFNLITYKISFTESGLPSGTNWSVTLNGITKSSSNDTNIFNEPNGSYSYIISGISGYRANTYSGTINVNGNSVSVSINWTEIIYSITITENGIPNGTSWSATLTGTTFNGQYINITLSSTTNTITFNEPNGTYSYIIHLPSGYQSNNAKGSVNVSGNSAIVTFKAQQTMNYLWIGIIAVVIIIAIVIGVILLRRGKNKQGVKEWKEPPKQN
jgi:YVTN family beta-propeller protein